MNLTVKDKCHEVIFFYRECNHRMLLLFVQAAIAQLGERQTEDLKVPGSIPGRGTTIKQLRSADKYKVKYCPEF